MSESNTIRVAAAQFAVGADIKANLSATLRMIDEAAKCNPDLLVLPEFSNHLSWYNDKEHCWQVSADLGDDFLSAVADKAKEHEFYVVVNVTLRRGEGQATGTSLCYSPKGELLADNDKQIYIGHENDFLEKATCEGPIIDTPLGRLGFYACMDGVINETPRSLGLRGAQVLCNSLNSFASDEGSLHIPVRAAENKVFVVAANKVGPLVPAEMVTPISQATSIPEKFLNGAGESQIVAPDGTVLAIASLDQEEVVFADIDVTEADNKKRSDGTDIFASRRGDLYKFVGEDPVGQVLPTFNGADAVETAVVQTVDALDNLSSEVKLACLPALVGVIDILDDLAASAKVSAEVVSAIQDACDEGQYAATSIVAETDGVYQHQAVLISTAGIVLRQGQVQHSKRFNLTKLSKDIEIFDAPFGRIALVCSDDSIYPEHFRRLAVMGVEIAAVPLAPVESWELRTGLVERSAENRINVLAATRSSDLGTSLITSLQQDFTVMTPWENRPFDGLLSQPILQRATAGAESMQATIYPNAAANKVVSMGTDLLAGRPWKLVNALTS